MRWLHRGGLSVKVHDPVPSNTLENDQCCIEGKIHTTVITPHRYEALWVYIREALVGVMQGHIQSQQSNTHTHTHTFSPCSHLPVALFFFQHLYTIPFLLTRLKHTLLR